MADFPALETAVKGSIADAIVDAWTALAIGQSATGDYVRGLHAANSIVRDVEGNPLALVVQNVSPHAIFVEIGHEGFHLPDRIRHWKVSKNGKRYIIVPFRQFAPTTAAGGPSGRALRNEMPADIYAMARGGGRLKGLGDAYKQSRPYELFRARGDQHVPAAHHYTWKASPYEGLQRRGGPTPGGGTQSTYMTFRVMTPDSEGWYIPPLAGKHYTDQVVVAVRPQLERFVAEAAAQDLVGHFTAKLASVGAAIEWSEAA